MDQAVQKVIFKRDSFAKSRGRPALLIISCSACNEYIMSYQKDGPGPLLRCYLDRIHYPEALKARQYLEFEKQSAPKLECEHCGIVIGNPIVYEKENRPAYHMRPSFFIHKKMRALKK
jgi:hypothetical protein